MHESWLEEILAPISDPATVSLETGCTSERQEKPGKLLAIAVASLPNILDIFVYFLFVSFFLLFGLAEFIRGVPHLLHPVVNLV